jgi:predicted RNA methylase
MTEIDVIEHADVELVNDSAEFFAPVDSDVIDSLLGRYQTERAKIERISQVVTSDEYAGAVQYFLSGVKDDMRAHSSFSVASLFKLDGAIFALNSRYWADALSLTDVYDCMPQARRDYWNAQIQGKTTLSTSRYSPEQIPPLPDFEESTVRNTLGDLLRQRGTFFAERVDGIFRGLSGDHVTNQPQGFGTRMIISYMLSYGSIRHERAGLINDLRCVIAKFMGRDEPKHTSSQMLVSKMYECTGQWVSIDGGTLRIRVYKKGTAHMEVHPDMAWRLNQVLASLYPLAIPAEFRAKPKKKAKEFVMMGRPLPFAVLELIAAGIHRQLTGAKNRFTFAYNAKEQKAAYQQACGVLEALGGAQQEDGAFEFEYAHQDVLHDLCITGCLPDQKAHQYYPTPEKLARIAVEWADIGENDQCLEPSAGQGGIAVYMPKERTTCVEVSPLHCKILESRGFNVAQGDFIAWADATAGRFDAIVMNPPFSEGRAKAHTQAAASLLKPGGRLVAILPASHKGMNFPGLGCEWSTIYEREFAGTGAAVVILNAVKAFKECQ